MAATIVPSYYLSLGVMSVLTEDNIFSFKIKMTEAENR